MIEFYPQIRAVHIGCVLLSILLFATRGVLVLAGQQRIAHWPPLRWFSYAVDSVLLSAALMLLTVLPRSVFANHWLSLKLLLLVVYVVLGSYALKRAQRQSTRTLFFLAALLVVGAMYDIARAHHPLGGWRWWAG